MAEIGEELVGAWLRLIGECDFVQYNVPLRGKQGEIDVIGINLDSRTAYVCEVSTHIGGLYYVNPKDNSSDNVRKLTAKFRSDVDYAREYLKDFDHRFMLWSPVVTRPLKVDAKNNAFDDLIRVRSTISEEYKADVEMVINEVYLARINELRYLAGQISSPSGYPVFRLLQILSHLESNVAKLQKQGIDSMAIINGS